jgi:hypothetical protein
MLQVFQLLWTYVANVSLDVLKEDLVLHTLLWTSFAAAGLTCMRVAVEGREWQARETMRA